VISNAACFIFEMNLTASTAKTFDIKNSIETNRLLLIRNYINLRERQELPRKNPLFTMR
jgi:hypothetical protein